MKNAPFFTTLLLFSLSASAEPTNVDKLLRTANLPSLIGIDTVLNLHAQTKDPKGTQNVNDLNDFIALGVLVATQHTVITEFDAKQIITNKVEYDHPWGGVARYSQSDIPTMTLQEGLDAVKACMKTPESIARVSIYKTIQSKQIVYDYAFVVKPTSNICQEFLYTPDTHKCSSGSMVQCVFKLVPR